MRKFRVTYSGLISFVISIVTVFTGLAFVLIVTRQLTPHEFGSWGFIGIITGYLIVANPINYWVTREISRGEESGRTAIITNWIFSSIAMAVFIIISFVMGGNTDADPRVLILGVMLIPAMVFEQTVFAIVGAWRPQWSSYGLLLFEISKIASAFVLVYSMNMGIVGAIIAVTASHFLSGTVIAFVGREKLKSSFDIRFLKKWLKLSWLSLYPNLLGKIKSLDVLAFSLVSGSVLGVAYYSAATAISNTISHTGALSRGLYPQLLAGGKGRYLQENLRLIFYFSLPLVAMAIIFSKPAMFTLNPQYMEAYPIVIITSLAVFFKMFRKVLGSSVSASEKVDTKKGASFKEYIKSNLFWVPTVGIIQSVTYLAVLIPVLYLLNEGGTQQLQLVVAWTATMLAINIPATLYIYLLAKKNIDFKLEMESTIKYFVVTIAVFTPLYFVLQEGLVYHESIFDFLPPLLGYIAIGIFGYLGGTYLIDAKTRTLFHSVINELKKPRDNQ